MARTYQSSPGSHRDPHRGSMGHTGGVTDLRWLSRYMSEPLMDPRKRRRSSWWPVRARRAAMLGYRDGTAERRAERRAHARIDAVKVERTEHRYTSAPKKKNWMSGWKTFGEKVHNAWAWALGRRVQGKGGRG